MLKQDLTLQILSKRDHCLNGNIQKRINRLMKQQLMKELARLKAKPYSYLKDDKD